MALTTINVEQDVRRQYNRPIFLCIRVKAAALLIGLWDLMIHIIALWALIIMFGQAPIDTSAEVAPMHGHLLPQAQIPFIRQQEQAGNMMISNPNFVSSNGLLNRILERRNGTRSSIVGNPRNFYSNLGSMGTRWAQSLTQQDKCIVFFVVFSATILILAHIYGVLMNKPSYIVPYFLIKVFNVIISILSMLGFYAYMPDITIWLRLQSDFPFKDTLLQLDSQTLQLVVFAFLLFIILTKLYFAAIVWYCYGYITVLTMARSIGPITAHSDITPYPILADIYSPPKYEEAIKSNPQAQETYAPPPYTPLLSSST